MVRRDFLTFIGACLTLNFPPVAANCQPEVGSALQQGKRLLHLRHEVADIGGDSAFLRLRADLAEHALDPWLRSWMQVLDGELPYRFEALVEVERGSDGTKFGALLDYHESFEPESSQLPLGFVDWLPLFNPQGRDDFLMALPLYWAYRDTGDLLPSIRPTPDRWLDALLTSTRGMLFWKRQFVDLVHRGGGVDHAQAHQLVRDYVKRRPDAYSALGKLRYAPTGQNMMQIIAERSIGLGVYAVPDYLLGDWLHGYCN